MQTKLFEKSFKDNKVDEYVMEPVFALTKVKNPTEACRSGISSQLTTADGVHFSSNTKWLMEKKGGSVLMCKVLLGRPSRCKELEFDSNFALPGAFDSHATSDNSRVTVYNADQILPIYVIEFVDDAQPKAGGEDFQQDKILAAKNLKPHTGPAGRMYGFEEDEDDEERYDSDGNSLENSEDYNEDYYAEEE